MKRQFTTPNRTIFSLVRPEKQTLGKKLLLLLSAFMLLPWFSLGHINQTTYAQPNAQPKETSPTPWLPLADVQPLEPLAPVDMKLLEPLQRLLHSLMAPNTYGNLYAPGNCTYGVASRLPVPQTWGNANTWAARAAADGFEVSSTPKVGAIAQDPGGAYGHVAVVVAVRNGSFDIWEENYMGLYATDVRTATTSEFPNFIYF